MGGGVAAAASDVEAMAEGGRIVLERRGGERRMGRSSTRRGHMLPVAASW
jgi:hypothetical protein